MGGIGVGGGDWWLGSGIPSGGGESRGHVDELGHCGIDRSKEVCGGSCC